MQVATIVKSDLLGLGSGPRIVGLIILTSLLFLPGLYSDGVEAQGINYSLRFYGHGVDAPDLDRVKIQIDNPANNNPGPPADVGAADFTLEFWMKAAAAQNTAGSVSCGTNVNWIYGNIVFDRDRYSQDRKFGISIAGGKLVFGVSGEGSGDRTICGTTNILNNQWHHIAVQRRRSDGWMWLYVDGVLQQNVNGPDGDISYPDNGVPGNFCGGPCTNSDPFLVIGAEKHDAGAQFPSYNGFIDEVRVSKSLRYSSNFTPPSTPFTTDGNTVALYHLNEGPAGACTTGTVIQDSSGASGGPSNGVCRYGGSGTSGPVYSTDTPFGGIPSTSTSTPTSTSTSTPTVTSTPTLVPTPDTTDPIISNVEAQPLDTSVLIIWDTNEPATSRVHYGVGSPDTLTTETQTRTTSHSVVITGLSVSTTYEYRVRSRDAAGNLAISGLFDFSTLSPNDVIRLYLPLILK